jgi:hypothetical protein
MSQFTSFIDGLPDLTQGVDPELQAALAAAQKNPRMAQAIKPSKWNNQETRSPLDILQAEAQSQAAPQGGKFDALIAGLPALPGAQPPEQTNALQAAVISGGRTMDRLAAGLRDATPAPVRDAVDWLNNKLGMGAPPSIDPAVQAANTKAYAPVAEQHPVASLVGSSIPLLAAASPLSMAGMGALEYGTPAERAMGAGAGFVGGKIGQGLGRLAGPETMRGVATDAGDFMNAAGNKWGIPTTVGQQPGASKTAQIAESVLANLPFGGAVNDARNASYQGFNRAVSKTFGQDTGTLTPEMFGQVLDQTGKQIGDVMGKARAKLSPAQAAEVADLSRVVADLGPEGHLLDKRLGTMIDGMTNGQTMSGQTLRMFDSSLGRLMGSDVGDVRYAAARMQNIVRDAAAASLPQAEQDALNLARRQNFNVRQVADAAKANPGASPHRNC